MFNYVQYTSQKKKKHAETFSFFFTALAKREVSLNYEIFAFTFKMVIIICIMNISKRFKLSSALHCGYCNENVNCVNRLI